MAERYGSLPFRESSEYFRQKLNVPTATWTDITEGAHARAFTVAGALQAELLEDFRDAVDQVVTEGGTLEDFRKGFDRIVARHGWSYNGGRGWRSRVIYETNLRTAYQAGRYKQLTDPDLLTVNPFWRYVHADFVAHPRPQHVAWNGLTLPWDSKWWETNYPPNGWGCRCTVRPVSKRDLERAGKAGPDTPPPLELEQRMIGARGPNPKVVMVPKGVDPGWGYNVGEAAWGKPLAQGVMDEWRATGAEAWEPLTPGDWQTAARPARVPLDAPRARPIPVLDSTEAVAAELKRRLGGDEKVFTVAGAPVLVDAEALATHVDPARSDFLPFLEETLADPYEVWLAFERHQGTGRVRLRARILKGIDVGRGRTMLFVANAVAGVLEAWTFIPSSNQRYIERQRHGLLLKGRE